jgi:RNA recognition motif-containing protein
MKNKPSSTVYISNLSYDRDRRGVRTLFSRYGKILNIKIIVEPKSLQSRGMAFVEMSSIEEATAAIKGLNGEVIDGRTLKANYAIPQLEGTKRTPVKAGKETSDYKAVQLAKKARNDANRASNPLKYKAPRKKVAAKKVAKRVTKKA